MAEPLKNIYSKERVAQIAKALKKVYPSVDVEIFCAYVFTKAWKAMELKERMRHLAEVLRKVLPQDYDKAVAVIIKLVAHLKKGQGEGMNFEYMFLPTFVELYGLPHLKTSLMAMEEITKFSSAEFAIRPFLIQYPAQVQKQMLLWSKHPDAMVRRLATEGFRPRLPWAMGVPYLKGTPEIILPVLENLKHDPNEIVRRSVANNLNDIAKEHPDLVMKIAKKWKGISEDTDKLIRHGCRTLLKRANKEALAFYGLGKPFQGKVNNFSLDKKKLKLGEHLSFSFTLSVEKVQKLRLEYGVDYRKANGETKRKIFKISELDFPKGNHVITRKQLFKDFTTRKHYEGKHFLAVLVNGVELGLSSFVLVMK